MKFSFLASLALAATMALVAFTGCDSGESPIPPGQPGQTQQAPGQQPGLQSENLPGPIDDADLERAAEAYAEIQAINAQVQAAAQQTEDPNEIQQLQVEANQRMAEAIENAGLDFPSYNAIISQIRTNNDLNDRFRQYLQNVQ